ncbi:hypothetical protein M422DRAFT_254550 [Sphaerobolus stellatus SS14]|uniref:Uncharacterized protein n=1 Tax=Sphaerobolus stellatus (strain SS14) TaxID=990650 RepID=A0A0C9VVY7_SPHS4|nr:hypothetical protein M422DRAFT_254550 [Sphaerobolus stellatus SS14]
MELVTDVLGHGAVIESKHEQCNQRTHTNNTDERRREKDKVKRCDPVKTCTKEMGRDETPMKERRDATLCNEEVGRDRTPTKDSKREGREYALNIGSKLWQLQPHISEELTPADDVRHDEHVEGRDVVVHEESSSTAH